MVDGLLGSCVAFVESLAECHEVRVVGTGIWLIMLWEAMFNEQVAITQEMHVPDVVY